VTLAIREVTSGDLPLLFAYLGEQLTENGRNGNPLFQPMAPISDPTVPPAVKARFSNGLSTSVGEPGWRRAWIAVSASGAIAGHIDLRARPDAEASHRALLGMGVHRDHRRAGLGMRLIDAAKDWARAQAGFDWIDLEVLSANRPAIALYERAGFHKTGEVADMFRIEGECHAYTFMSLPLN
jgi:ribosomal protein S18 acetylase RimI-like enzyme